MEILNITNPNLLKLQIKEFAIDQLSYSIPVLTEKFAIKLRLILLTRSGKPQNLEIYKSILITNKILNFKNFSSKINSPKIKFEKTQNEQLFAEWEILSNPKIKSIIIQYGYYQKGALIEWNTIKKDSKIKKLIFADDMELVYFFFNYFIFLD